MTTKLWHRSGDRQLKKVAFAAAPGARVQFYAGGTTTPLTTYVEAEASTPHNTASLVTDGNGLWPNVFIPYGFYDYRILDSDSTIITTATNVPNPAPVDPTSTDPNALMQTGDMIFSPAAVTRAGFVRANGNTIGSGASSATERANNDAESLFTWLWNNLADAQAAVSSGRGGTAAADWSANKVIATPDLRGSSPLGLDDMGAGAASRLVSGPFTNGNATTGGSVVGANTVTLLEGNLPSVAPGLGTLVIDAGGGHTHSHTISVVSAGSHNHAVTDPTHSHLIPSAGNILIQSGGTGVAGTSNSNQVPSSSTYAAINPSTAVAAAATGISINSGGTHSHSLSGNITAVADHTHTISGTLADLGSDTPTNIVGRSVLGTFLIKL